VTDRERWVETVTAARDRGLVFFDLLTAVDVEDRGFEVVLHLWDPVGRTGELLRTTCPRDDATVPTLTGVFAGAAWHERATAELFGIGFAGHITAPLLLSESFEGHPLRKDFVLATRVAKPWPGAKEPGESTADIIAASRPDRATRSRRRQQPPGVPKDWGQS
jgi:NADH-quinone oxidoreductase subunit C